MKKRSLVYGGFLVKIELTLKLKSYVFNPMKRRNGSDSQVPPQYWWTERTFNHQQPPITR